MYMEEWKKEVCQNLPLFIKAAKYIPDYGSPNFRIPSYKAFLNLNGLYKLQKTHSTFIIKFDPNSTFPIPEETQLIFDVDTKNIAINFSKVLYQVIVRWHDTFLKNNINMRFPMPELKYCYESVFFGWELECDLNETKIDIRTGIFAIFDNFNKYNPKDLWINYKTDFTSFSLDLYKEESFSEKEFDGGFMHSVIWDNFLLFNGLKIQHDLVKGNGLVVTYDYSKDKGENNANT